MVQTLRGRWVGTEYVLEEEPMTEAEWLTSTDPVAMLTSLNHGHGPEVSDRKLRLFACAYCRQVWHSLTAVGRRAVEFAERYANGVDSERNRQREVSVLNAAQNSRGITRTTDDLAMLCLSSHVASDFADYAIVPGIPSQGVAAALLREIVGNPFRRLPTRSGSTLYTLNPVEPVVTLTPTVLMLAGRAYEERVRRCELCTGPDGENLAYTGKAQGQPCRNCGRLPPPFGKDAGRIEDGSLDPMTLAILADALEEVGMVNEKCRACNGKGILPNGTEGAGLCAACGPGRHDHCGAQVSTSGSRCGCKVCWGCTVCSSTGRTSDCILTHLRSPGPHVRGCHVIDLLLGKE